MNALEPGQARITHPAPGVEDAVVPASAVPHWQRVGWELVEGDAETWPAELQRFGGQAQVRIYHPELDRTETVAESAVPHWRSRGWVPAEQAEAERAEQAIEGLTLDELKEQARARGLPVSGTKAELQGRLQAAVQEPEQAGEEPATSSEEGEG